MRISSSRVHYIRTKDEAEVDFCLSEGDTLTDLIECKLSDPKPHRALVRFAEEWPAARATHLVRDLRHAHEMGRLQIQPAAAWLDGLAA